MMLITLKHDGAAAARRDLGAGGPYSNTYRQLILVLVDGRPDVVQQAPVLLEHLERRERGALVRGLARGHQRVRERVVDVSRHVRAITTHVDAADAVAQQLGDLARVLLD